MSNTIEKAKEVIRICLSFPGKQNRMSERKKMRTPDVETEANTHFSGE